MTAPGPSSDNNLPTRRLFPVLMVLLTLTLLLYSFSFKYPFIWDDGFFITGWSQVRSPHLHYRQLISGQVPVGQGDLYRPFRSLLYALSISIFGANPFLYHLQAVLLYLSIVLFIFLLSYLLTQDHLVSLLATGLFALHPLHPEAVVWITASFDTFGILFFFASLAFYLYYLDTHARHLLTISLALSAVAFLTYELTLTLPFIILSYHLLLKRRSLRSSFTHTRSFFFILALYWLLRLSFVDPTQGPTHLFSHLFDRLLLALFLIGKYLSNLFVPFDLSLNYSLFDPLTAYYYPDIAFLPGLPSFPAASAQTLPYIITALSVFILIKLTKHRLVSFLLVFIVITLLPVLQFIPQRTLFTDRYAVIASFGSCLFIAFLAVNILRSRLLHSIKLLSSLALTLYLLFFTRQSLDRIHVFSSNSSVWEDAYRHAPASNYVLRNLGASYIMEGQVDKGFSVLHLAVTNQPHDYLAHAKLGQAYYQIGDSHNAIGFLTTAVSLRTDTHLYQALADAYLQQGDLDQALLHYRRALELNPHDQTLLHKLSSLKPSTTD